MSATVIVPTFNEAENIPELVRRLRAVIPDIQVLVVDDNSPDGTAIIAQNLGCSVIVRREKKGLSSAVIDGFRSLDSDIAVVMDADLQHSPELVPELLDKLKYLDIVIVSRYCKGGSIKGWPFKRRVISRIANLLSLPLAPSIKDRTSGYFALRRDILPPLGHLNDRGFKILLETLVIGNADRIAEIPFTFKEREAGASKFTARQVLDYLVQLWSLYLYRFRWIKFGIVGTLGACLHFAVLYLLTEAAHLWYMLSAMVAVMVAFVFNYIFNSIWTFAKRRDIDAPDYDWKSYFKGNLIQKWWKRQIARAVWQFIPVSESLLDIGCGSSPIITHYPGATGIDTNRDKLKYLEKKVPEGNFALISAEKLEFKTQTFDDIICIEVLEHLSNPENTIAEIARVLKPGGRVALATPDYSRVLWRMAERFTPYKEDHCYKFTKEKLEQMCLKYGLKPVQHKYIARCDLVELFEKPED